ncbi:uncharacterized protein SCHCODRAFT_02639813 [Schizophyllum commune H4-8]|uniref:uncharacterized protein n=1 Tax=Schizophyllum commune (strain H4-8 / FGSC 9210) TaxID=578458 RepID=UPI0021607E9D|nr:uncharacterized protein SCHCODRAFT_02639813 [Schizophyllum commune H4-8]KAI5886782.1 hypothetical protein SCHCODRAFT_02639813 [Schizophyllum commune H4-8]
MSAVESPSPGFEFPDFTLDLSVLSRTPSPQFSLSPPLSPALGPRSPVLVASQKLETPPASPALPAAPLESPTPQSPTTAPRGRAKSPLPRSISPLVRPSSAWRLSSTLKLSDRRATQSPTDGPAVWSPTQTDTSSVLSRPGSLSPRSMSAVLRASWPRLSGRRSSAMVINERQTNEHGVQVDHGRARTDGFPITEDARNAAESVDGHCGPLGRVSEDRAESEELIRSDDSAVSRPSTSSRGRRVGGSAFLEGLPEVEIPFVPLPAPTLAPTAEGNDWNDVLRAVMEVDGEGELPPEAFVKEEPSEEEPAPDIENVVVNEDHEAKEAEDDAAEKAAAALDAALGIDRALDLGLGVGLVATKSGASSQTVLAPVPKPASHPAPATASTSTPVADPAPAPTVLSPSATPPRPSELFARPRVLTSPGYAVYASSAGKSQLVGRMPGAYPPTPAATDKLATRFPLVEKEDPPSGSAVDKATSPGRSAAPTPPKTAAPVFSAVTAAALPSAPAAPVFSAPPRPSSASLAPARPLSPPASAQSPSPPLEIPVIRPSPAHRASTSSHPTIPFTNGFVSGYVDAPNGTVPSVSSPSGIGSSSNGTGSPHGIASSPNGIAAAPDGLVPWPACASVSSLSKYSEPDWVPPADERVVVPWTTGAPAGGAVSTTGVPPSTITAPTSTTDAALSTIGASPSTTAASAAAQVGALSGAQNVALAPFTVAPEAAKSNEARSAAIQGDAKKEVDPQDAPAAANVEPPTTKKASPASSGTSTPPIAFNASIPTNALTTVTPPNTTNPGPPPRPLKAPSRAHSARSTATSMYTSALSHAPTPANLDRDAWQPSPHSSAHLSRHSSTAPLNARRSGSRSSSSSSPSSHKSGSSQRRDIRELGQTPQSRSRGSSHKSPARRSRKSSSRHSSAHRSSKGTPSPNKDRSLRRSHSSISHRGVANKRWWRRVSARWNVAMGILRGRTGA